MNHSGVACFASKVCEILEEENRESDEEQFIGDIESKATNHKRWYEKVRICLH